jgi:hypothetical protein
MIMTKNSTVLEIQTTINITEIANRSEMHIKNGQWFFIIRT